VALSDDRPESEGRGDAIAAIDTHTRKVIARYAAGSDPEQFAISSDRRFLYSSNEDAGTATITDLQSRQPVATLIVGIEPEGVAISPDDRWVYVTAETSNSVSVIDTRTRKVVSNFMVDPRPRAAAFSPVAPRAYVTAEIGGSLSVIDTNRHRVIHTIDLGDAKPVGVVVSPNGKRVFVANGYAGSVTSIALLRIGSRAGSESENAPGASRSHPTGRNSSRRTGYRMMCQ
jgi:YVTN family beta-propeller protein